MKKLMKSEVCGSCEQCTRPTDGLKSQNFSYCSCIVHEQQPFQLNFVFEMCEEKKKGAKRKRHISPIQTNT